MNARMLMMVGLALAGLIAGAARAGGMRDRLQAWSPQAVGASEPARIELTGYYNSPLDKPPKRPKDEEVPVPYGFFVGPMVQFLNMDLGILDPMTANRHLTAFSDQMFLVGMTGGVIHGHGRYGAFFLYGDQQRRRRVDNKVRTAEMLFQGGGLVAEYSREYKSPREREYLNYVPYVRFGYIFGGMFGIGQLNLTAQGHDLGKLSEVQNSTGNGTHLASKGTTWALNQTTMIAFPYVGVWVSPYDWLWIELDLGYLYFTFDDSGSKTRADNGKKMVNGAFKGGPQIGLKILFGENPNVKVRVPEF
jgi:hypothetical protein